MDLKEDSLESPIQKLDEDSLICILSKLPIADLVRVERVSKSWQEIAKKSWSGLKKLDFRWEKLGLRPVGTDHAIKKINKKVFEQVIIKCGRYLKQIHFSLDYDRGFVSLIAKYCKNIQLISCFSTSTSEIEQLAVNCRNITELSIKFINDFEVDGKYNQSLGKLILKNRNLRSLKFDYNNNMRTADSLLSPHLDEPLGQLTCLKTKLKGKTLINVLKRTRKLSSFYYSFEYEISNILEYESHISVLKFISIYQSNLTMIPTENNHVI